MSVADLQRAVGTDADGVWGPKSREALRVAIASGSIPAYAALIAHVAQRSVCPLFTSLASAMAQHLPAHGITDTPLRLANFLGQASHETMGFRYLREIWGPTKAQKGYEGRVDLGNTHPGDGRLFLGRGIFQITGRGNYQHIGSRIGIDLAANPALAETPDVAVLTACDYWDSHGLAVLADSGREDQITRKINGGTNGIDERRAAVARAKEVLV